MSDAFIRWIGGPVLHARTSDEFHVGEAIEVGDDRRPGEVIRLTRDELVGQVYEDTTGLRPGDIVRGSGAPLSVPLGPRLLGRIFDGLLRPLEAPRPQDAAPIGFRPLVKAGDTLQPGTPFGDLPDDGVRQQCLLPPRIGGTVGSIVTEGAHHPDATLCKICDAAGAIHEIGFSHRWPIRQARPVRERLPADTPMITGQRILDTLFPVARGSRAAIARRVRHRQDGAAGNTRQMVRCRHHRLCRLRRARQRDGRSAARASRTDGPAHRRGR